MNHAIDIELACIAVISTLITPEDMDNVMCLICGACPKIVNSDGNAKDTIKVTDNMKFIYEDESDPPTLENFKADLVQTVLKKSFFQNEPPRQYNMLKLPLIMAPSLRGKQINNDIKKKTLLEKKITFSKYTLAEFAKMVDARKLNILGLHELSSERLTEIAIELKLENPRKKSSENIRSELNNLFKLLIGIGQVHKFLKVKTIKESMKKYLLV